MCLKVNKLLSFFSYNQMTADTSKQLESWRGKKKSTCNIQHICKFRKCGTDLENCQEAPIPVYFTATMNIWDDNIYLKASNSWNSAMYWACHFLVAMRCTFWHLTIINLIGKHFSVFFSLFEQVWVFHIWIP